MPRQLRHHVPGGWYHITTRGIGRRTIFETDRDHEHFLELLAEMVERYSILLHAHCELSNHYHLLLESPEGNVSQAMQWLNTSYSVWFNLKHSRSGALFQSRFKSIPVDSEGSWALECAMYVHLNPVRIKALGLGKQERSQEKSGMIPVDPEPDVLLKRLETLRSYRWSSYPAYAGYVEKPSWLYCDELWRRGCDTKDADPKREYREWLEDYLKQGVEEKLFTRMTAAMAVGSTRFKNKVRRSVLKTPGQRSDERQWRRMLPFSEVTKAVERVAEEPWNEICLRRGGWARDLALCVGQKRCGLTLKELGDQTGMKQQAVCNAVARFRSRMEKDELMKELYYRVLKTIGDIESV